MFDGKYGCGPVYGCGAVLDSGLEGPVNCSRGGAPRLDGVRGGGGGDES